jgi:hypothetical protein
MGVITVRFMGICCFVAGREGDRFAKRAVLPADQHAAHHDSPPHIAYVEIEADDLADDSETAGGIPFTRSEGSEVRSYRRFDLNGERVSVRNVTASRNGNGEAALVVVPTFDERVPAMTRVCPECPPQPRAECFDDAPPRQLIASYFDIGSAYLSAGPVEEEVTAFDEGSQWPARRLARWAQVDATFEGDRAELVIEKFDGSSTRTIPLSSDASVVTVGNQLETDILGTSPRGTDRRAHFAMYYDLGENLPEKRPRPTRSMGGVRGCAPTTWP